jgi:hypothetical protein
VAVDRDGGSLAGIIARAVSRATISSLLEREAFVRTKEHRAGRRTARSAAVSIA